MNPQEYVARIHKVREALLHEVQKDATVALGGDVEGAKQHLGGVVKKLQDLIPLQEREEKLFPELKQLIHQEIALEKELGKLLAQFVQSHDEKKQQLLLPLVLKALDELETVAQQADAAENASA